MGVGILGVWGSICVFIFSSLHALRSNLDLVLRVFLHSLLNPGPRLSSVLLHRSLILDQILNVVRRRNMSSLLGALSLRHAILPRLQVRELLNINTSPSRGGNPAPV